MQQLAEEITRAVNTRQTIGIYFNWNNWGEYRSGFVLVSQGELLQLAVHDQGGRAALARLNTIELREVLVHPLDDSPRGKDADVPKALELLSLLQSAAPKSTVTLEVGPAPTVTLTPAAATPPSQDLMEGAKLVLLEWLGPDSGQRIEQIATQFPPDRNPMQFLNGCQKLIEPLVGLQKASRLFDPLRLTV